MILPQRWRSRTRRPGATARTVPATPLHFVPNLGQFAAPTRFFGFTSGATVRIEDAAVTYQFHRAVRDERSRNPHDSGPLAGANRPQVETLDIRATFPGARPAASVDGVGRTSHLSHFASATIRHAGTHVPGYEGVGPTPCGRGSTSNTTAAAASWSTISTSRPAPTRAGFASTTTASSDCA